MSECPPEMIHGFIAAPPEALCLDFANTRFWRGREAPTEELHGFSDVLAWSEGNGGADGAVAGAFRRSLKADQTGAFAAAIALRETLFRIFAAVASGETAKASDLQDLNAALAAAAPRSHMAWHDGAFVWSVGRLAPSVPALLSPVLWSAADLLAGARRDRVRQCDNPQCRWVFLDDSKGGNRRWCSMASCGNRAKAHRHYLKRREQAG